MSGPTRQGQRVELVSTTDELTELRPGARGYVSRVDSAGTVHVLWDSGSRLGLIPDEDEWKDATPAAVPREGDDEADQEAMRYERTVLGRDFRED